MQWAGRRQGSLPLHVPSDRHRFLISSGVCRTPSRFFASAVPATPPPPPSRAAKFSAEQPREQPPPHPPPHVAKKRPPPIVEEVDRKPPPTPPPPKTARRDHSQDTLLQTLQIAAREFGQLVQKRVRAAGGPKLNSVTIAEYLRYLMPLLYAVYFGYSYFFKKKPAEAVSDEESKAVEEEEGASTTDNVPARVDSSQAENNTWDLGGWPAQPQPPCDELAAGDRAGDPTQGEDFSRSEDASQLMGHHDNILQEDK